jgi:DNA replication protein DnaC
MAHQQECALVWFQLVDSTGKETTNVDAVSLPLNSLLVQFRDAVKAKYADSHLKGVAPSDLIVYQNKKKDADPCKSSQSLNQLGTTDADAMFVVVPASKRRSADMRESFQILEENKGLKEYLKTFDEEKYFKKHPFLHAHRLGKNLQSKAADELCELFGSCDTVVLVGVSGCGKSHAIYLNALRKTCIYLTPHSWILRDFYLECKRVRLAYST